MITSQDLSNVPIIKCQDITKQYEPHLFFALRNISFQIMPNQTIGILGSNGAGKSTLIQIMAGVLRPSSGHLVIKNTDFIKKPFELRQEIGVILDKSFLYDEFTIKENLEFYGSLYHVGNKADLTKKISQFLTRFNLSKWIDEPVRNLSKGMRQKVELIRVLIHDPKIILMDEPFSGLDINSIEEMSNILLELRMQKKATIIFSTHQLELASRLCDESIILKQGKITKIIAKKDFQINTMKSSF